MKQISRFSQIIIQALIAMLLLNACGAGASTPAAPTTPTINPVDAQITVVAATYFAAIATQSAMPTATPPPPTETLITLPDFTLTIAALPTSDVTSTPTPTANPYASDPCVNQKLPATLTGEKIKIRIDNPTKATINVSVYLQSGNPQGVCGYRGYALTAGQTLVINDLVEGCYSLWAWNPDPQDYFMVTNGTSCLNASASWTFDITPDGIKLRQ